MPKAKRHNTAFTIAEVKRIKRDLVEGRPRKHIARAYGVGLETVARIARGDTWGDVSPDEIDMTPMRRMEAELLVPREHIDSLADRLIKLQEKAAQPKCRHCELEEPINPETGKHITIYGEEECLKTPTS